MITTALPLETLAAWLADMPECSSFLLPSAPRDDFQMLMVIRTRSDDGKRWTVAVRDDDAEQNLLHEFVWQAEGDSDGYRRLSGSRQPLTTHATAEDALRLSLEGMYAFMSQHGVNEEH